MWQESAKLSTATQKPAQKDTQEFASLSLHTMNASSMSTVPTSTQSPKIKVI